MGIPNRLKLKKYGKPPKALKLPYSLNFRHKKRRPWTSFFVDLVGRGDLNPHPAIVNRGLQHEGCHFAGIFPASFP